MNLINNLTDKEAMDLLQTALTAQEWQDFNNMSDADRDEYFKGFKACLDEYIEAGKDKPTPPGGGDDDREIPDDGLRHWRPRNKKDKQQQDSDSKVKDNRQYVDDDEQSAQQAAQQAQKAAKQAKQAADAAQQVAQQAQQNNSPTAQQTQQAADAAQQAAQQAQQAAQQGNSSSAQQAAQQAQQAAQQAQQAAQDAIQNAIDAGKSENKNMNAQQAAQQAQQAAQQAQQAAQQAQQAAQDAMGTSSEQKAQQAAQNAQQAAQQAQQAAQQAEQAASTGDGNLARQHAQDALQNAQDAMQSSKQAQQAAQQAKNSNANAAQQAAQRAQQAAQRAKQSAESALQNNNRSNGQYDSSVSNAQSAAQQAAEHAKQAQESAAKAQECAQKGDIMGEETHAKAAQQAVNKAQEAANRAESAKRNTEGNENNDADDRDDSTRIDSSQIVKVDISDVRNAPNDLFPDGMDAHEIIKKLAENAGQPLDPDDYADPTERAKEIFNKIKNDMPKSTGRGFGNSLQDLADTIEELFKSTINWRAKLKKLFNSVAKHNEISVMSKRRMGLDPSHLLHKGRYMHPNQDFEEETDGLMQVFILIDNSGSMQMTTGSGHDIFENIISEIVDLEIKTNIQNSALAYFSIGAIRKNAIHTWTAKDCKNKRKLIDKIKRNTNDDGKGGTSIGEAIASLPKLPKKYFNDKSNPKTVLICISDGYDNLKDSAIQALSTGLKNQTLFLICNDSNGVLEGSRDDLTSVGIKRSNILFVKPSEEW